MRQLDGRSLSDIADQVGISASTLSRIENGKQALAVTLLVKLAGILGVPAQLLLEGEAEKDSALKRLAAAIMSLSVSDRAALWREVATRLRRRPGQQQRRSDHIFRSHEVLACVEVLNATLVPRRS